MLRTAVRLASALFVALAAALLTGASAARAELDYEFGQRLMEADRGEFRTGDLVERLLEQLKASPATVWDGKLLEVALKRRQVESSGVVERQAQLLGEIEDIYKDFLAKAPKDHRLREKAESGLESVGKDRVKTLLRAAKESPDPAKAKQMQAQATQSLEVIAKEQKAIADKALPRYKADYEKFEKNMADPKIDGDATKVRPAIIKALDESFDEWIVADKRYVAVMVDILESYGDKDPAKKKLGGELIKHCETCLYDQGVLNFPLQEAFYHYMQGKCHAQLGESEKARDSWRMALSVGTENMPADQKRYMRAFQSSIFHELIRMNMRDKAYESVIRLIEDTVRNEEQKQLLEGPQGRQLLVDYAEAIALHPDSVAADFEEGIRTMLKFIRGEEKSGHGGVVAQLYVALSKMLDSARLKKMKLRLYPDEWYYAARGYFMAGHQYYERYKDQEKEDKQKANEYFGQARDEYEKAIRFYQQAITAVRANRDDQEARLRVEPKCWLEIGLCHWRLGNYLETTIALTALLDDFTPHRRAKWLPDPARPEGKKFYTPVVKGLLKDLDEQGKGVNLACTLINATLGEVVKVRTPWRGALRTRALDQHPELMEIDKAMDREYFKAKSEMEKAKAAAEAARVHADPKAASDAHKKVAAAYVAAGELFLAVKPDSRSREQAFYQAGSCYAIAKGFWASGKIADAPVALDAKIAELSHKALQCFDQFAKFNPDKSDLEADVRKNMQGLVLYARTGLYIGLKEWEKAVQAADQYLAWEQENPPTARVAANALLEKTHALMELSKAQPAKAEASLKTAEDALTDFRSLKPDDTRTYLSMVESLRGRYGALAGEARKNKLPQEVVDRLFRKAVDLQVQRMLLLEQGAGTPATLSEYFRTIVLLRLAQQKAKAVEWGEKLMTRFDPQDKGVRIPDEPQAWKLILDKIIPLIRYDDLGKRKNCSNDHATLVDLMYDTLEGFQAGDNQEKRPPGDKFPQNLEKARQLIQTIKNNYPDCLTLNPAVGPEGKSWIQAIEEEIELRQTLQKTRELVLSLCLDLAGQASADPARAAEARAYRERANKIIKTFVDQGGKDEISMKLRGIQLDMANAKYDVALEGLLALRAREDLARNSTTYFDISKNISECYRALGRWKEAAEYPAFLGLTVGFRAPLIVERWPDIRLHLKACGDNGVPMPPGLKERMEEQVEPELDTEPKAPENKPESKEAGKAAPKT